MYIYRFTCHICFVYILPLVRIMLCSRTGCMVGWSVIGNRDYVYVYMNSFVIVFDVNSVYLLTLEPVLVIVYLQL